MSVCRVRQFEDVAGGEPIFPLVVLFFLYFFDEFDTAAFGVLAPEIQKTFHLSDAGFVAIVILNLSVVLLLAVPSATSATGSRARSWSSSAACSPACSRS